MGNMLRGVSIFATGVIVGSLIVPALSAQLRTAKATRVTNIDLAGFCDGKEVLVDLIEDGPGTSGKHYHPGYSISYVVEGAQISTVEGRPPMTVKAGDVLYEEPMQTHTSETPSTAKVFSVRIVEKGKPTTIRVP